MSPSQTHPFLPRFYSPTHPASDPQNRTLVSILSYTNNELEYHHDYIQLLFPLPEPSPFNPFAPVIDPPTFHQFRSSPASPALQSQLQRSFDRMLSFYGFDYDTAAQVREKVRRADTFERQAKRWVKRFNHNHLRITRILRSLRVLACERLAEEFWAALQRVEEGYPGAIGERSYMYWERAIRRPLWVAPDMDVVPETGEGWLWDWEQGKATGEDGSEGVVNGNGEGEGDDNGVKG